MEIKICLFDDSPRVIESLTTLFELVEGIEIVKAFQQPTDVVYKVNASKANLIVMDIDMPETDGIAAVKTLRANGVNIPIIMFTVFEDEDKIFEAICAGANGYLLKNTEPHKLIDSIKEAMDGGAPMSPVIARKVLQMFAHHKPALVTPHNYELTPREGEILKQLTLGLSYKMIASECNISFETVRTHIKNIYAKLHVASMTEAVAKAIHEKLV
jgi:DNA-binding NarL/FixJ family response regulator